MSLWNICKLRTRQVNVEMSFFKNSTSGEYILVHKTRDVYVNKIIIIMKNSTGGTTYVHKTQDVYACEI